MTLDIEKIKECLDCDDAFVAKVIENFITESGITVKQLQKRLQDHDLAGIKSSAHKILSSTRILEIDGLTRLFEKIEVDAAAGKGIAELQPQIQEARKAWYETIEELKEIKNRLK